MDIDLTQRVEWLSRRMELCEQDKEYIRFQMKEAVLEALANSSNDIHNVSGTTATDCGIDGIKTTCNQCGTVIKEYKHHS